MCAFMSNSLNHFSLFRCEAVDMADESWIFRWTAAHYYFARHMQKSTDLVRRVRSTVEAVILLLATKPSSFNSSRSWLTCLLGYSRFPYQEKTINTWFRQKFRSEDGQEQKAVNVMNVDLEGVKTKIYRTQGQAKNFPDSLSNVQFEVFCHGTNHESAQNIIDRGIDLNKERKGRRKAQDFSDGDGYYVSNSFDDALEWAYDNTCPGEGQAVLVYRVNKKELRGENNDNGLDLRDNKEKEWLEVVREYRRPYLSDRRRRSRPNNRLRKECKQLYFIEGPITSGSNNPPSTDYNNDSHQLCVRNEICAQLFNISLHSVVFFEG